jgi:hypothetical protein
VQEKELNTISPNKSETKVNKEYNNFASVVHQEVLWNSLVEYLEEVNMVLEKSHDISPLKLLDSPPTMLDIQHFIDLEQHALHPLMIDVQHDISL